MNPCELLMQLVATESFSRNEAATAQLIFDEMENRGYSPRRHLNNVWAVSQNFDPSKPTLLLNSHHDTVKPSKAYTRNPFLAEIVYGKLYGLGSNDAGASVVALMELFGRFHTLDMPLNLLLAITAEEEVTGEGGMRAFIPNIASQGIKIDMALVGEPTDMQPAIAERGLVVLDCVNHGRSGHAARGEGINALYLAMDDIERIRDFQFPNESAILGPVTAQVTQIEAGSQHNVVPAECRWVVDVRTTDAYSNEQTVEIISNLVSADVKARSTRVRASVIDSSHPLVRAAIDMGKTPFVSPTTSDMSQMSQFPSLKMGPGHSGRSHTADEFVLVSEITSAIEQYTEFLNILFHETR